MPGVGVERGVEFPLAPFRRVAGEHALRKGARGCRGAARVRPRSGGSWVFSDCGPNSLRTWTGWAPPPPAPPLYSFLRVRSSARGFGAKPVEQNSKNAVRTRTPTPWSTRRAWSGAGMEARGATPRTRQRSRDERTIPGRAILAAYSPPGAWKEKRRGSGNPPPLGGGGRAGPRVASATRSRPGAGGPQRGSTRPMRGPDRPPADAVALLHDRTMGHSRTAWFIG